MNEDEVTTTMPLDMQDMTSSLNMDTTLGSGGIYNVYSRDGIRMVDYLPPPHCSTIFIAEILNKGNNSTAYGGHLDEHSNKPRSGCHVHGAQDIGTPSKYSWMLISLIPLGNCITKPRVKGLVHTTADLQWISTWYMLYRASQKRVPSSYRVLYAISQPITAERNDPELKALFVKAGSEYSPLPTLPHSKTSAEEARDNVTQHKGTPSSRPRLSGRFPSAGDVGNAEGCSVTECGCQVHAQEGNGKLLRVVEWVEFELKI
ncbi:hypothetical protein BDP27DRAFT_1369020 [Rhodocollybia butyracea]|uniref:Uncharacterized protein n=1 Tax=Rhodocollybia butyracea TaxID=206335 RepID=A0A9P5PF01_9AGAR|nr:hypothetical protein BDP27DRAFT_1369020 [Rhodocollybia butyracea]